MRTLISGTWNKVLEDEMSKPYFDDLTNTLVHEYNNYKIYPKPHEVFKALDLTPFEDVKVVMLSQDPYPHDHSHGLAFSSPKQETPYSLKIILREVDRSVWRTTNLDEYRKRVSSNDLSPWAKQGVLLLNTVLTVRAGNSNSHDNIGWQQFTSKILELLWNDNRPKVFCIWGNSAKDSLMSMLKAIDATSKDHLILSAGHPASGAHATDLYSGNNHFIKINEFLIKTGQEPINWELNGEDKTTSRI